MFTNLKPRTNPLQPGKPPVVPSAAYIPPQASPRYYIDVFLGIFSSVPLAVVGIELGIDAILVLLALLFAATVYFIFVSFLLLFLALAVSILLNTVGCTMALIAIISSLKNPFAAGMAWVGLLLNGLLLTGGLLVAFWSYSLIASQPARASVNVPFAMPPAIESLAPEVEVVEP